MDVILAALVVLCSIVGSRSFHVQEDIVAGHLLGLDYGTGGAKACLIDGEGNVLGYAFEGHPLICGGTGRVSCQLGWCRSY